MRWIIACAGISSGAASLPVAPSFFPGSTPGVERISILSCLQFAAYLADR
jgi:hypothetical protein